MPTIKEIAQLAETSTSSVSRVINSSGYVGKAARERIQRVLDETGYRPNALAKALHSKRSQTIGVILPKINATSSGENIAGIDHYYADKGYSIILGNTNHNVAKELEFLDVFREKQVDGIILVATEITPEHEAKFKTLNLPLVVMGQSATGIAPSVVFDEAAAAKDMVDYLISENHQRIAYISVSEADISIGQKRKQGYLNALSYHKMEVNPHWIAIGDFSVTSGYTACQAIFDHSHIKPDCVFAANDKMAIGAINYLLEHHYRVPEDVSVCGVGGGMLSAYYNPKITSLVYDFNESGRIAAELLHGFIDKSMEDPKNHVSYVPYSLAVRESTQKK
ncbi:LacI family DNA-binding transcriptional regulator [Salinivibrio sp. IB643]|jgi:Transcriptional regulators|uniref:LacI family DNA-binding transcriptional regulator n=1 Tax=Salinivibrio TaxID=51366 RepID=UPI000988CB17|nr:LacI family DNA-binding transcriptional regulator [Salinivibrio sp. IB643]OOE96086.1 hypothetical protein BZG77_12885 [Salinivibrio sp. IB643]